MKKLLFTLIGVVVLFSVSSVFADTLFVANLSGDNEAPDPIDSTGVGLFVASLNEDMTQLTVIGNVYYLDNIILSHIHRSPAGVAGPVVFGMASDYPGDPQVRVWNIPPEMVDALFNEELYVNVHTRAHQGGEIRGQLLAAK